MLNWLHRWICPRPTASEKIWQTLWPRTLARYPFLSTLSATDQIRLQALATVFLADKEFTGANGLVVTDTMALAVAAQACLPLLHLLPLKASPSECLAWYGDFVNIVLHPGPVLAQRSRQDENGIMHQWREALSGEAVSGGPVMLNWADVDQAGQTTTEGHNLVIHEFAHKLDLRNGQADGCPPLPQGFAPQLSPAAAYLYWRDTLQAEFEQFCELSIGHVRFGLIPKPWLDDYASTSLAEFFAVASEAYFVNPAQLAAQSSRLHGLLQALYRAGDMGCR